MPERGASFPPVSIFVGGRRLARRLRRPRSSSRPFAFIETSDREGPKGGAIQDLPQVLGQEAQASGPRAP
jgi:hypothetical protein